MPSIFENIIDQKVIKATKNCHTFYRLVRTLPGIHPIDIKSSLSRLRRFRLINKARYQKYILSAEDPQTSDICRDVQYAPVPHILNYDWRFSQRGVNLMMAEIRECVRRLNKKENIEIAFLGCPSLMRSCFERKPHVNSSLTLIDINADRHKQNFEDDSSISFLNCNLATDSVPNKRFDILIMDPPWYLNYNKIFFDYCSKIIKLGGYVLAAMPPLTTKDNSSTELNQLEDYYTKLGFVQNDYKMNFIKYNMPPFERNVLRVHKILCLPSEWRTGDLLIAKKINNGEGTEPITISEETWEELSIGLVRFKIRHSEPANGSDSYGICLESPYDVDDIYPSVKRSFSSKKGVNVWTSGNRVYICNNIPLLKIIIKCLCDCAEINWLKNQTSEKYQAEIDAVIRKLKRIAAIEESEYGQWVNRAT